MDECLLCRIFKVDVQFEREGGLDGLLGTNSAAASNNEPVEHIYRCMTDLSQDLRNDQSYSIDLPPAFLAEYLYALNTGTSTLCISGGEIVPEENLIRIPDNADISILQERSDRRKLQFVGERSVLAVRVQSNDVGGPYYSANNLAGAIFSLGTEANALSLRTQYHRCSGDQLYMEPAAEGQYPNVINGVLELNLGTYAMNNVNIFQSENEMTARTEEALGIVSLSDEFDHVM
jgi:hypothetical protein